LYDYEMTQSQLYLPAKNHANIKLA